MTYKEFEVEITDIFECGGIKLAAIRAKQGKPFIGGDTYPNQNSVHNRKTLRD